MKKNYKKSFLYFYKNRHCTIALCENHLIDKAVPKLIISEDGFYKSRKRDEWLVKPPYQPCLDDGYKCPFCLLEEIDLDPNQYILTEDDKDKVLLEVIGSPGQTCVFLNGSELLSLDDAVKLKNEGV